MMTTTVPTWLKIPELPVFPGQDPTDFYCVRGTKFKISGSLKISQFSPMYLILFVALGDEVLNVEM